MIQVAGLCMWFQQLLRDLAVYNALCLFMIQQLILHKLQPFPFFSVVCNRINNQRSNEENIRSIVHQL